MNLLCSLPLSDFGNYKLNHMKIKLHVVRVIFVLNSLWHYHKNGAQKELRWPFLASAGVGRGRREQGGVRKGHFRAGGGHSSQWVGKQEAELGLAVKLDPSLHPSAVPEHYL